MLGVVYKWRYAILNFFLTPSPAIVTLFITIIIYYYFINTVVTKPLTHPFRPWRHLWTTP